MQRGIRFWTLSLEGIAYVLDDSNCSSNNNRVPHQRTIATNIVKGDDVQLDKREKGLKESKAISSKDAYRT